MPLIRHLSLGFLATLVASLPTVNAAPPVPTVLAQRGILILDDDGSAQRGSKVTHEFESGAKLRAGAGAWARSPDDDGHWRSTWSADMGHTPVASYQGFESKNLIAEVTFRYGPITTLGQNQSFRIAFDNRPKIVGHVVSAWANLNNDFIETGFLLQHIRKHADKSIIDDQLLDHQPFSVEPEVWHTATLEVVGDEALFRLGDHVAYAQSTEITRTKNLVSITLGNTWHEIKRVRIWEAEVNSAWPDAKTQILAARRPYSAAPHRYTAPAAVAASDILIAAHRGGYETDQTDHAPENSVANIRVSQRKGFALYETDIQRTSDGHFVIVHDATLDRETTGSGHASDHTLAELKQRHKRYRDRSISPKHVATLAEFLREGKNRTVFKADLKPGMSEHFPTIMKLVEAQNAQDGIIFRVPYREAGRFAQYRADGVFTSPNQLMFMVSNRKELDDIRARFNPEWVQVNVTKTNPADPETLDLIRTAVSQGLAVESHAEGTSNDWAKMIHAGVRMFHTNHPTALQTFLEQP